MPENKPGDGVRWGDAVPIERKPALPQRAGVRSPTWYEGGVVLRSKGEELIDFQIPSINHTGDLFPVFVYGTLKSGFGLNHYLRKSILLSNRAYCYGSLVDLGPFPAFKSLPRGKVYGEVYLVDKKQLYVLDAVEGALGENPLYIRKKMPIRSLVPRSYLEEDDYGSAKLKLPLQDDGKEIVPAMIYAFIYVMEEAEGEVIETGIWEK